MPTLRTGIVRQWTLPVVALLIGACGGGDDAPRAEATAEPTRAPAVYAVNYPLAYMAERIGGEGVDVVFPVPADVDPASWSPEPDMIAAFQGADLVLLNGAGYAGWVSRATLPESRLVNTMAGQEHRLQIEASEVTHSHGPEGEHSHDAVAFTTWLDPTLALEQARMVRSAFTDAWPDQAAAFGQGFAGLEADLTVIDADQAAATEGQGSVPILGSHPVYQYLAARYGLNLQSVHFEPDEMPDAAAWRGLQQLLSEHPAEWMLWEGEPRPEVAERLREMGIESVVYDPAANRPEQGDYLTVMRANVEVLRAVYAR